MSEKWTWDEYIDLFGTEDNECDERYFHAGGHQCACWPINSDDFILFTIYPVSTIENLLRVELVVTFDDLRELFQFKITLEELAKKTKDVRVYTGTWDAVELEYSTDVNLALELIRKKNDEGKI
jgi:hypothetical protein